MILDIVQLPFRLKPNDETGIQIVFNSAGDCLYEVDDVTKDVDYDDQYAIGHWFDYTDVESFKLYKSIEVISSNVMMERVFFSQDECNPLMWTIETNVKNIKIYPIFYRLFDVRNNRMHQKCCFKYANGIKNFLWATQEEPYVPYDEQSKHTLGEYCSTEKITGAPWEVMKKIDNIRNLIPMHDSELSRLVVESMDLFWNFGCAYQPEFAPALHFEEGLMQDPAKMGVCQLSQFFNFASIGSLGYYSRMLEKSPDTDKTQFTYKPMQVFDLYLYDILTEIAAAPFTDIDIHVDLSQAHPVTCDIRNRYLQGIPYPERQVKDFVDGVSEKVLGITKRATYGGNLNSWDRCHIRKTWEEELFWSFWDGKIALLQEYTSIPILAAASGTVF